MAFQILLNVFIALTWMFLSISFKPTTFIVGYLLGSINSAIVVSKLKYKQDIRDYGSKNAGMTNMFRVYGKTGGLLTLAGDFTKTLLAVLFADILIGNGKFFIGSEGAYVAGFFCMLGHIFPLYYKFKGGKGVSAIGAMILLFDWRIALICYAVFAIVLFASHTVSMGSLLASLTGAILTCLFYAPRPYWWVAAILVTVMVAIVWIRHHSNIKRLLTGTENKFNFGKKK